MSLPYGASCTSLLVLPDIQLIVVGCSRIPRFCMLQQFHQFTWNCTCTIHLAVATLAFGCLVLLIFRHLPTSSVELSTGQLFFGPHGLLSLLDRLDYWLSRSYHIATNFSKSAEIVPVD
ncbi:hypothetical protein AUC70_10060 [Methyloceanibacter stevinii]|uniref:Uncharacterized protein n=1 Tax=Methyloceanibacter stevinii TaxID=1774970 RepID=A0A1E3VKA5_9HYPH|nr:hypothetical protein AUC70_10060 [Methyloceanibacter stevinii]